MSARTTQIVLAVAIVLGIVAVLGLLFAQQTGARVGYAVLLVIAVLFAAAAIYGRKHNKWTKGS